MITPVYIASIVDKFLSDNNLLHTRSTFRKEASFLFPNSSLSNQVDNGVLNLENILNEYIELKAEKARIDQERVLVMQEKNRIRMLLQGIHGAVNFYNVSHPQKTPSLDVADEYILEESSKGSSEASSSP